MSKTPVIIGIDLGGTKTDIGVVDAHGSVLRKEIIPTSKEGPHSVVLEVFNSVKKIITSQEEIQAIGVGMAGQIESSTGLVHFAPNLGWKKFPLGNELESLFKAPIKIINDVRAATWGEWHYGAGKGEKDLICLFVGTGIGGGIVSGGKMLTGSTNAAGEVGHMTIDLHGPNCTCGNRGCFEAIAGGWAIARRVKEMIKYDSINGKKLLDLIGGDIESITARNIFEAYRSKSVIAMKVVEEVKEALVAGMTSLVNAFNPAKVILGGGIITGCPELIEIISEGVKKRALKISTDDIEFVAAKFKDDAGVIGAAAFASNLEVGPST